MNARDLGDAVEIWLQDPADPVLPTREMQRFADAQAAHKYVEQKEKWFLAEGWTLSD